MLIIETVLDKLYSIIDGKKQDKLIAGAGIDITDNTITAKVDDITINCDTSGNLKVKTTIAKYNSETGNTLDLNTITTQGHYRWYVHPDYGTNFPSDAWTSGSTNYNVNMYVFLPYAANRFVQLLIINTTTGTHMWVRGQSTASTFNDWTHLDNSIAGIGIDITDNVISTKPIYGVCDTADTEAAKTVTIDGYTLRTGDTLAIKFTYRNTVENATLSVNGGTAYPMCMQKARAVLPMYWTAGEVVLMTFDGTQFELAKGYHASVNYYGPTKLYSSLDSTSNTLAATASTVKTLNDTKQDKLTAGADIQITDNIISTKHDGSLNTSSSDGLQAMYLTMVQLTATTDLDTVTTNGNYKVPSQDDIETYHRPTTGMGTMQVFNDGYIITQIYHRANITYNTTYIRRNYNSTWSSWNSLVNNYGNGIGYDTISSKIQLGFPTYYSSSSSETSVDLNTIITRGFHRMSVHPTKAENFPTDFFPTQQSYNANLLVMPGYSDNRTMQVLFLNADKPKMYMRRIAGTTFDAWVRIPTDITYTDNITETAKTKIGSFGDSYSSTNVYIPTVTTTAYLTTGVNIGTISVGDTGTDLYAPVYTAGDNITISSDNVISATDTTYTAGEGINIANNVIGVIDNIARYDSSTGNTLDLNTITAFGRYRWYVNTNYASNFPEDAWPSGALNYYYDMYVIKSYSVNRNIQVLIGQISSKPMVWIRNMKTATTFGAWVRIDNSPQLEPDVKARMTPVGTTVPITAINSIYDPLNIFTYQWQYSTNYGSTWNDSTAEGCTTNTVKVPGTAAHDNYYYRCKITGATETFITEPTKLIVVS